MFTPYCGGVRAYCQLEDAQRRILRETFFSEAFLRWWGVKHEWTKFLNGMYGIYNFKRNFMVFKRPFVAFSYFLIFFARNLIAIAEAPTVRCAATAACETAEV